MATVKIIGSPLCWRPLLPNAFPLSNEERMMITGASPKTWARGVPGFLIAELEESLAVWTGILGFQIAFSLPEQDFVDLKHPVPTTPG
jgi:hypothetical protein